MKFVKSGQVRETLSSTGEAGVISRGWVLYLVWAEMGKYGHLIYIVGGCACECRSSGGCG